MSLSPYQHVHKDIYQGLIYMQGRYSANASGQLLSQWVLYSNCAWNKNRATRINNRQEEFKQNRRKAHIKKTH